MSVVAGRIGYWILPNIFYANAKYSTTYNNKQHFQTNTFQVQFMLIIDWLKQKSVDENKIANSIN